ncbi:MAG: DNA polymerase IV [Propionibacteriaceae bacterium]|nr:DNA polymerase IV [Propionibacteriaceae bacterium]
MRDTPSILHLDLDAFFAAVEQRDKPSLRGKPVIVGGVGMRSVVATASYEARVFGVHSAMPMHEARRRCPHAAFLCGRFRLYQEASRQVMAILRELSPLVETMSLDEAFVDLRAASPAYDLRDAALFELAQDVRRKVNEKTGGLTASIGLGSSKFIAKVGSELAKPDGVRLIRVGDEVETIAGLGARAIPGVGPATMERLTRLGVKTVADIQALSLPELVRELGKLYGEHLFSLVRAIDDREVVPVREAKSISVEDTFEHDIVDRGELKQVMARHAEIVASRLVKAKLFARTVTLKVRWPDFSITSRSRTTNDATNSPEQLIKIASALLDGLDTSEGVRLLGVGVSGFTDVSQGSLFELDSPQTQQIIESMDAPPSRRPALWLPGVDVLHDEFGSGWVWGSGLGRVTVRFETAETEPGPVRTFALNDSALHLV